MSIVLIQLSSGVFVVGKQVDNSDANKVTLVSPLAYYAARDHRGHASIQTIPYGYPFYWADPKEKKELTFNAANIVIGPIEATEEQAKDWRTALGDEEEDKPIQLAGVSLADVKKFGG